MRLVAFIVGVGFGALGLWAVYPILYPPTVPAGYHNLSAIPDDIAAKFEDPEFLDRIVKQERQLEDLRAEMAATPVVSLPDSVAPFPFGSIYAPKDTTHWPVLSDDTANAVLEAAKTDWVILNIWATWCAPCRKEMPMLSELQTEFGGEAFEVVTIATGRNPRPAMEAFFDELGVDNLPHHADERQNLARSLGVLGLPVTLILDPEGNEIARLQGDADWHSDSAVAIINALVDG